MNVSRKKMKFLDLKSNDTVLISYSKLQDKKEKGCF